MKPTFSSRYISDKIEPKLKRHTLHIIVSDMGTGKSFWVDKALENEKGATLVSTRISQTIGILKRNPIYKSYQDIEHKGYLDVS